MDRELLKQIERGATILTASQRLARVLAENFTDFQRHRAGRLCGGTAEFRFQVSTGWQAVLRQGAKSGAWIARY